MWIGTGDFEDYGYLKDAYLKGKYGSLDPNQCYRIDDVGPPNSELQFHVVPVDSDGKPLGPSALSTSGSEMYNIWSHGQDDDYNVSNAYIASQS